jgi:hypothetical protein
VRAFHAAGLDSRAKLESAKAQQAQNRRLFKDVMSLLDDPAPDGDGQAPAAEPGDAADGAAAAGAVTVTDAAFAATFEADVADVPHAEPAPPDAPPPLDALDTPPSPLDALDLPPEPAEPPSPAELEDLRVRGLYDDVGALTEPALLVAPPIGTRTRPITAHALTHLRKLFIKVPDEGAFKWDPRNATRALRVLRVQDRATLLARVSSQPPRTPWDYSKIVAAFERALGGPPTPASPTLQTRK